MRSGILRGIVAIGIVLFVPNVYAQELYKCVTSQGTSYQSRPCAAKSNQKTTCTGSVADGFNGDCRAVEQQRQQAMTYEKNAYTQDLASNKVRTSTAQSEFQRARVDFVECKQRIVSMQRYARYASRPTQLIENNNQFYAARICTDDGSVYLSCNATTNTLLTQTSPTCSLKR